MMKMFPGSPRCIHRVLYIHIRCIIYSLEHNYNMAYSIIYRYQEQCSGTSFLINDGYLGNCGTFEVV